MKKYIPILIGICFMTASCDDFLSQVPDNRTQIDSKEKIAELLVTAYPEANYMMFCEAMSDNVEDNPAATQDVRNSDAYFWREISATTQDTPEYYWNACYTAIASANHALEAIENADEPEAFSAQKGEALLARAYAHFMLVNLFSKTHNSATAAHDPGIPYVTEPEKESIKEYERKSVQYVYDMIEKDLLEGLPLIDDQSYATGNETATGVSSYHFTKSAAHAFASRYYLFRKDYEKVIEHSNAVLMNKASDLLRPWNTAYRTLSSTELALNYTKSSEEANLLLAETASEWARSFNGLRYAMGARKYQELFLSNPTGGNYAYSAFYSSSGVYFIYKFREHFVRIGTNATTGFPYTMIPLFSAEEVLFNRAEAYLMLEKLPEAMADINIWASTRISDYNEEQHQVTYNKLYNYYQINNNKEAILTAILDFRRVEFIHEGLRWFDIRRHEIPVRHTTVTGESIQLLPGDPRRVLQIPREAISMGGLEPNPR